MEGTIKIEAIPNMGLSVMVDVKHASKLDMIACFDALAEGFHLDENDRRIFGLILAAGGIEATGAAKAMTVELDKDLYKILEMMREKNNETDAH